MKKIGSESLCLRHGASEFKPMSLWFQNQTFFFLYFYLTASNEEGTAYKMNSRRAGLLIFYNNDSSKLHVISVLSKSFHLLDSEI